MHVDQDAGIAPGEDGALPSFDIAPGSTLVQPIYADPHNLGSGTSVKIARYPGGGVLQLEYSQSDHLYWDLSDLDGGGAGVVVSPFRDAHVRLTPTGNGVDEGVNKCWALDCPAGQTCQESYQDPNQEATRVCPVDTGDLILDLCLDGGAPVEAPAGRSLDLEERKMVHGRRI